MDSGGTELVLERGQWFGWQMLPGYDRQYAPYFSPILVQEVTPKKTGRRMLHLRFVNVGYLEGGWDFDRDLKVLAHDKHYLIGSLAGGAADAGERCAVISRLNYAWLQRFCPEYRVDDALASGASVQEYLFRQFPAHVNWLDD